jgi:hypothetical protein
LGEKALGSLGVNSGRTYSGKPQITDLYTVESRLSYFNIPLIGVAHIEAILGLKLIWLAYIARQGQWGGRGRITSSNDFYLPSRRLIYKEGTGESANQYPVRYDPPSPFRAGLVTGCIHTKEGY